MQINCHSVVKIPQMNIFQYDIVVGSGAEKRAVLRKIWTSSTRVQKTGPEIIYDGNKLAWSTKDLGAMTFDVDLDLEAGRQAKGKNKFRVNLRRTKTLNLSLIDLFLSGRVQLGNELIECLSFLDHLLREGPSQNTNFVTIKRSFFGRNATRADLGNGIEVFRGIYQSIRLAEGQKMVINVDVSNCCFWQPTSLTTAILVNKEFRSIQEIAARMKPDSTGAAITLSNHHRLIQSTFKGVFVKAKYNGNPQPDREWKIAKFDINNANEGRIELVNPQTKKPTGQVVTIAEYFLKKYNLRLQYPQLPLVEMTKKNVKFPMELLHIQPNQRYSVKLSDLQTSKMIKFAVTPPKTRFEMTTQCREQLGWSKDRFLTHYGLQMDHNNVKTNARLLPPPDVKFGNKTEKPETKGRWDLRGKTFLSTNPQELVSWGVGVFPGRTTANQAAIQKFVLDFTKAYRAHGGKVAQAPPYIMQLPADAGQAVEALHQATGNKFQKRPQLLVFIVQDKTAFHYLRIKKSCDCRYGVVSQVMQIAHVLKGSLQYYSNVLMKVNAKLGGCTSQALSHPTSGFKGGFRSPTMIIGADISHASPGSTQASMAAITVSFDKHAGRFAAACQTNGHRLEMITENNMRSMLGPLASQWVKLYTLPTQIYFFRDGVTGQQFEQVLKEEVPAIKGVMDKIAGRKWDGKLTVVVANKRHHIRAFPVGNSGDPKGNPLPGCLIERDATSPFEWDFFLYSHVALQGTARPTHYTIIYDESNHKPEMVQNMIYEHCYQYMRSTTSVSLYPAVYYAHLASNRAKAHEDISATKGPQGGPGFKQNISHEKAASEVKPLLPMFEGTGIKFAMWYI